MCGIAGQISSTVPPSDDALSRMLAAMVHRGPDGEGRFADHSVVLGMRRLAIVGLETGWQPLFNEDRSLALVVNGEIYNFIELRADLRQKGHQFRTESDCETILHLYEEHGLDFVRHLRGMFALALWDSRKKRLILARDRMGEKPLYLVEKAGTITFSSEMKSILASGAVRPLLDGQAIAEFMHYCFVNDPRTPFCDVRKLPPAGMLVIDTHPWTVRALTYWSAFDAPPIHDNPKATLVDALNDVGRLVIRADVPVGVALSGGVDSSLVACLAGHHLGGDLTAISAGYQNAAHEDETEAARWLAEKKGWKFHRTEISDSDATECFDDIIAGRDDPIADISGIGYSRVNEAAHGLGVKVMLFGQGGDELFWGYRWVRAAALVNRSISGLAQDKSIPTLALLGPASTAPLDLARWVVREGMGLKSYLRITRERARAKATGASVLYTLDDGFVDLFDNTATVFTQDFARSIDRPALLSPCASRVTDLGGDLETIRLICSTYLLQNGLAQGDRLSMRASVEARLPLVDYRLVETIIGLKKAHPDLHLPAKSVLQSASRDLVPPEVFSRPKRGFSPPARRWFAAISKAHGARLSGGRLVSLGILQPGVADLLAVGESRFLGAVPLHYKALVLETWIRMAEDILGETTSLSLTANADWVT